MKAEDVLEIARKRIGKKESPPNSNSIDCNDWYYNKKGIKGSAYPWCCVEMQYVFHLAGASNLLKRTASCSELLSWFKKNGRFYKTPQVGDLVFYNFSHPNSLADHVGIVDTVNKNGSIYAIEGNTSVNGSQDNGGAVLRRLRTGKIVGYGRPKYDNAVATTKRATLKEGSKGADVTYLKKKLSAMGFGNLSLENDIYTKGVGDAVQYFQITHNLKADRICGEQTWNALG